MIREHLKPLHQVVVDRLGEDVRLAIDEGSEHDTEFMHDLLPLLARSLRPNRIIPHRHQWWCDALIQGRSYGLEFSEVEESRILSACVAVRASKVVHLIDSTRVDDLLNAASTARRRRQ